MGIPKTKLRQCVAENDIISLNKILDASGVTAGNTDFFSDEHRQVLSTLLIYASACAKNDDLREEFVEVLIKRVGHLVEVKDFLETILAYGDYQPIQDKKVAPPHRLIREMRRIVPNESIVRTSLRTMNRDQFLIFSEMIANHELSFDRKYVSPILFCAYQKCVVPHDICLAYIAGNLRFVDGITANDDECPFGDVETDPDEQ